MTDRSMDSHNVVPDDHITHNTQSGHYDQGPGVDTNFRAEGSISFSPAYNFLHETPAGSSAGPIVAPSTCPFAFLSLGDAVAAAGASNPTKRCPYPENKRFLASLLCPFLKQYRFYRDLYLHPYNAQGPAAPLQDPAAPLHDPAALLQDATFTFLDSAAPQGHLSNLNFELASHDGQSPHLQDPCGTGNYASQSICPYSDSVSISQPWPMAENQMQNVDGTEHLGNYLLPMNTGISLPMGTSAGLQYGSASPAPPVPVRVVQPFSGGYFDIFQGHKEVISSSHDDIFLPPSIEAFAECGATTQPPTQGPDQQSSPTDNTVSATQQDPPVSQVTSEAESRSAAASVYPDGTFFDRPYVYTAVRSDKRKHNCKHELKEARARTDA